MGFEPMTHDMCVSTIPLKHKIIMGIFFKKLYMHNTLWQYRKMPRSPYP